MQEVWTGRAAVNTLVGRVMSGASDVRRLIPFAAAGLVDFIVKVRALLLVASMVWCAMAIAIVLVTELQVRGIAARTSATLHAELTDLVAMAGEPAWTISLKFEDLGGLNVGAFFRVRQPLLERLAASGAKRNRIEAQRWLLGEAVAEIPTQQEAESFVSELQSALPPEDFAALAPVLDAKLAVLEARREWPRASDASRLAMLLEAFTRAETWERCFELVGGDRVVATNLTRAHSFASMPGGLQRATGEVSCLLVTEHLGSDVTLRYGTLEDSLTPLMLETRRARYTTLLAALAIALAVAVPVSRIVAGRSRHI